MASSLLQICILLKGPHLYTFLHGPWWRHGGAVQALPGMSRGNGHQGPRKRRLMIKHTSYHGHNVPG